MAKKTRTELSTLAINTNLPDNTSELITPTTERAQLTDERESVVNYKDDLGGATNAGKFLTVAVDGESLTMVDEPSGVPAWVTFQTAAVNLMKLLSGTTSVQIQFFYDDAGVDTLGARISFDGTSKTLLIGNDFVNAQLSISSQFNFIQGGAVKLRIENTGDLTHNADIMALNAQQAFGSNPLYTFKFQGKVTGPSGGSFTFEEFANIKGGKENATENDKAGYLSFTTGIADGTLTERLRISSSGLTQINSTSTTALELITNQSASSLRLANVDAASPSKSSDWIIQSGGLAAGDLAFYSNVTGDSGYRLNISSGGAATFSGDIIRKGNVGNISFEGGSVTNINAQIQYDQIDSNTGQLFFKTANSGTLATRLTISPGGNVLFGGLTSLPSSTVFGSAFWNITAGRQILRQSTSVTSSLSLQQFFNPNGEVGSINVSGSSTSYNTSSDYRLKENVTPITDALSRINQLKPSRFNFIADADRTVDGFLAHEVQEIIPEAIIGEKDAMKDEEYELTPRVDEVTDEEGNVITEAVEAVMETRSVPDYQGIDQSKIVPLLTAAIQEQQTIIADLITRLEALEA